MRWSYSRVDTFVKCPCQFRLRYIDKIETFPDYDNPANPLIIGTAMHHGIEQGVDKAIEEYYAYYPIINDLHVNEAMKIRALIPKVLAILPEGGRFETPMEDGDKFLGFIDWTDGKTILDFKYSNNVKNYIESKQVHVYKHYSDKLFNTNIEKIGYLFIPKVSIRQKKTESIVTFRQRLEEELQKVEPKIEYVPFDEDKVEDFFRTIGQIECTEEFWKNQSYLCNWCEYKQFCEQGVDLMVLPSTTRRTIGSSSKKTMWIYGQPFSGKTTLVDNFPSPLMLNTDGNIRFVTAPFIPIREEVVVDGRITRKTLAWQVFKDTIDELSKKDNEFKTIVVDLVEDTYEACRLYLYDKMGIKHESDDSFKAWDMVRTEFLSTIKRLMMLDYENIILISHEDSTKDITKRTGDKITSIKPNIADKVATKLAGMVDIVIRCKVVDGEHLLSFKQDEVVFGGGRLSLLKDEIPCEYEKLMDIYNTSLDEVTDKKEEPAPKVEQKRTRKAKVVEPVQEEVAEEDTEVPEGHVTCVACGGTGVNSKGRKCAPCNGTGYLVEDDGEEITVIEEEEEEEEEAPKTRERKRRSETPVVEEIEETPTRRRRERRSL